MFGYEQWMSYFYRTLMDINAMYLVSRRLFNKSTLRGNIGWSKSSLTSDKERNLKIIAVLSLWP